MFLLFCGFCLKFLFHCWCTLCIHFLLYFTWPSVCSFSQPGRLEGCSLIAFTQPTESDDWIEGVNIKEISDRLKVNKSLSLLATWARTHTLHLFDVAFALSADSYTENATHVACCYRDVLSCAESISLKANYINLTHESFYSFCKNTERMKMLKKFIVKCKNAFLFLHLFPKRLSNRIPA